MFIEGVKNIQISGGKILNIDKTVDNLHDLLVSSVGVNNTAITSEVKVQMQNLIKKGLNKSGLKSILTKSREFANNMVVSKKIMISSVARRFGFDVGLVYLASCHGSISNSYWCLHSCEKCR